MAQPGPGRTATVRPPTLWHILPLCLGLLAAQPIAAQNADAGQTFTLGGTVVNSVTGEPVARAMVLSNGVSDRMAFSDSEGHFQFEGMPPGHVTLMAQKPGYFTEQNPSNPVQIGPGTGALTIKLVPQAAIFGRVTDAAGQPIEHTPVRLTAQSLRDGRKRWEQRGMQETDDDGHFRFASLMPGTYYLAAGPQQLETQLLASGQKPSTGYPHLFYPGVPDLASAMPIQVTAGQQAEADFALSAAPVYEVSGSVSGRQPDQGVGWSLFTSSGDDISLPIIFDMETGTFRIEGLPAGSYILKAFSQAGLQPLRAELRLTVASNLENLRLALAPAISIPIVTRLDSRAPNQTSSASSQATAPVWVHLVAADASGGESFSTSDQRTPGNQTMVLQNVDPGTYSVEVMPQPPWYVQSATWGQTNILTDDITVAAGQSYPLEIVLRNDSASLTATVRSPDGGGAVATLVVVPMGASRVSARVVHGLSNTFTVTALAPGDYLVFAFDRIDGLEYSNPEALEPYASQAAHVTLDANQKAQVALDLIHTGKEP
ncbi:MAG TPA: carboxypeptidase-like regulatory domain-containing protein [Candidatus Binatia bacterium]|nr:carboxypeptidase-like regulatory domain-containing protein [Candidatus Binatia bacterium]